MLNKSHRTCRMYSSSLDAMMREVLHTLGDIDFAAEVELENVEVSARNSKLKEHIKVKIRAAHREKRQPYVELLETLRRQQHRQSFAA
jgi:organic hydroperoxide reductase OsmC/OhrA